MEPPMGGMSVIQRREEETLRDFREWEEGFLRRKGCLLRVLGRAW